MIKDSFITEAVRLGLESTVSSLRERAPLGFEACAAILDSKGELVTVSGLNPLHYVSFETCVKSMKKYLSPKINEVFITNDPSSGNTRLCDLMLIQGAFGTNQANELRYFLALQITVPHLINKNWKSLFSSVEEEGYRVPPSPLEQSGVINPAILDYLCQSGLQKSELITIFQRAKTALKKTCVDLIQKENFLGREKFQKGIEILRRYSEDQMRRALHEIPDGEYESHDFMDDDGLSSQPIRIQCRIGVQGENILLSFSGSSKQTAGPFNCNYALTLSACFATLRGFIKTEIPVNSGAFKAFSIEAQEGTVVNATYPSALFGGYFETSIRISEVIKAALSKAASHEIPSLSGGSSSLCIMKFEDCLLVETIGFGTGASSNYDGVDGVKGEFDNAKAASIEELESKYPLQIIQNSLRDTTGGTGKHAGGRGLTRGYRFLRPAQILLLGDRKNFKIQGFYGGNSGHHGETVLIKNQQKRKVFKDKAIIEVEAGDTLFINSPCGAGWGQEQIEVKAP